MYLPEHDRRREVVHQPEQDRWQEGGSAQLQEIKDITHVSSQGAHLHSRPHTAHQYYKLQIYLFSLKSLMVLQH